MHFKIFFFLLSLSLISCYNDQPENKLNIIDKKPNIAVVSPMHRSFESTLALVGNVFPNKKADIHSMEGGYVYELYKDIGDKVMKGEPLALLRNPELTRQFKVSKVLLDLAEGNYLRLKKIKTHTPQLTTVQEFEKVEASYLTAKFTYEAIVSRYDLLNIKSPFSGILTKRNIELGELVQSALHNASAKYLFEVMDTEVIRISVALPETEVDNIHKNMYASIRFPEIVGEEFIVTVSRMANVISNQNKTMEVQFDIKNSNNKIKPGMFCDVSLQLESTHGKLSLPIRTLIAVKGEYFLLHVINGVVYKVKIEKGLSNNLFYEVISDQIDSLSHVVIEGKSLTSDGSAVNIFISNE